MTTVKTRSEVTDARHAVYGLIIVTATLVAEMDHVDEASHAVGLVLGNRRHPPAGAYVQRVGSRANRPSQSARSRRPQDGRLEQPPRAPRHPRAGPALQLRLARVRALQTAYIASIGFSLLALFGLGVYVGRIASMNWSLSLLAGATSGAIGVAVVLVEVLFD